MSLLTLKVNRIHGRPLASCEATHWLRIPSSCIRTLSVCEAIPRWFEHSVQHPSFCHRTSIPIYRRAPRVFVTWSLSPPVPVLAYFCSADVHLYHDCPASVRFGPCLLYPICLCLQLSASAILSPPWSSSLCCSRSCPPLPPSSPTCFSQSPSVHICSIFAAWRIRFTGRMCTSAQSDTSHLEYHISQPTIECPG